MSVITRASIIVVALSVTVTSAAPPPADSRIHVDQFGYRPSMVKVAVLSDPVTGYNAPSPYTPSATLEIRRWSDDTTAWTGTPVAWRAGVTHSQSGDRVWWLDFTSLSEVGSFYVFDLVRGIGSGRFEIAEDAYELVLREAARSLFFQRCGVAKSLPWSRPEWADGPCHVGAQQDLDCRAVTNPQASTSRDLHGGWHDAGDYNKYINFADLAVHMLLDAWEIRPAAWGDDFDIPESGNCISDLLDEIRTELNWFLRMQLSDGSVLHKVSVTNFAAASPPSADLASRRYGQATASATISGCGALAHGAIVFRASGSPALAIDANIYEAAARAAWNWLEANPSNIPSNYANTGFMSSGAEDDAYQQAANRTCAAVYMFDLTGETVFRDHVDATYTAVHLLQWSHAYPFEPEYQDCLLRYASLAAATPAVATAIRNAYRGSIQGSANLAHWLAGDDAYRAYLADGDYTWGSNMTKAQQGNMYYNMVRYGLDPPRVDDYRAAAASYLHYLHGVNPVDIAYLSAMEGFGAERSVSSFYHSWFADGSLWDDATTSLFGPAPGFVPGGANPSFRPDPAYTGPPIAPPENQPIQKSYRSWNTSWPEDSWEVTENAIGYQASYLKLLAAVVPDRFSPVAPASPGNTLRAVRQNDDVSLTWVAPAGASWYELRRCDATVASCIPAVIATPVLPAATDTPSLAHVWYTVAAANGCGTTP